MLYPVKFGHFFIKGELFSPRLKGYPNSQVTIKTRWSDGSACHAIFAVVIEGNSGLQLDLQFEEGVSAVGTPPAFPFDATIELFGTPIKISALPIKDWLSGPVLHSFICADHTGARDVLSDSGTKARAWFTVDYFPQINNAEIRFVIENSNSLGVGECHVPARMLIGTREVYSNLALPWQSQMMRWGGKWAQRHWVNGNPPKPKIVKHNLAHMTATQMVPNFNTADVISESRIQGVYQDWLNCNKSLGPIVNTSLPNGYGYKPGLWEPRMPAAGGRPDIGVFPTWPILWLYSGDYRMQEVSMGQLDLSGAFGCQLREGKSTKDNYQGTVTTVGRPTLAANNYAYTGTNADDRVPVLADLDSWNVTNDVAHRPNFGALEYALSGDYYALETLLMNASHGMYFSNGAATSGDNDCGRGPTGKEGHIPGSACGSIRQQAWGFLHAVHALAYCPDDMREKAYFRGLVNSFIEINEGIRNLTPGNTSANYLWGKNNQPDGSSLNVWELGNGNFIQPPLNPLTATKGISGFESGFMGFVLGVAKDLKDFGFNPDKLVNYFKSFQEGMIMNLGPYVSAYRYPTTGMDSVPFSDWQQVLNGFEVTYEPWSDPVSGFNVARSGDHGYTWIARAAAATLGSKTAFDQMILMGADNRATFNDNPKWDILPR